MSNIIDSIQLSGVTYTIQGSGGGGKAIEAGRGISVTTGATADTVSFNLPISAGTRSNSIIENFNSNIASGAYSHAEGYYTTASGAYSHAEGGSTSATTYSSHAEGYYTLARGSNSHAEGYGTITNNEGEHASGKYNVSHTGSTEADNTLFSVGNGTYDEDRRNAFEIREDGSIFISSGYTTIKLQDHIGGGGNPTVELTQAEYDALVTAGTVSADTYYIITDAQAGDLTNYYTKNETNTLLGGKADTATTYTKTEVDNAITAATSTKQDTLVSGTNIKTINNTSILGSGNIDIQGGGSVNVVQTTGTSTTDVMSQNAATSNFIYHINLNYKLSGRDTLALQSKGKNLFIPYMTINGEKVLSTNDLSVIETSAITTSITSSSTDAQVPSAKAVNDKLGGLSLVKLTQSEYDALATKDNSTLYVIVN